MPLTIDRLKAEASAKEYTRRNARKYTIALLGDSAGNVDVTGRDKWVWVRIEADDAQLTQAKEKGSVAHVEDLVVIVERVLSQGATGYQVVGIAPVPDYPNNSFDGSVGSHAWQHERINFGLGGFDPVENWTRMSPELRARQQATPNMTVYVEAGKYPMLGVETVFLGGNSPTVTAPAASYSRCDLLYLNESNVLTFANGTPTVVSAFTNAPKPTNPTGGYFPIAYIYTQAGQTTIAEANIEDARLHFASAGTGGVGAHAMLSTQHSDTTAAAVVRGDVITGQGVSPTWKRLAKGTQYQTFQGGANEPLWDALHLDQASAVTGALPAANLGVHDIITLHTYTGGAALDVFGLSAPNTIAKLTPSSNPGAAAAILASTSSGGLTLQTFSLPTTTNAVGHILQNSNIIFHTYNSTANQYNIFLGKSVGNFTMTPSFDYGMIGIGSDVLTNNTSGYACVGIGLNTLAANTTGNNNFALGVGAMNKNTQGNNNVAIGDSALYKNTTGGRNIFVGSTAGYFVTSSDNVGIGYNALSNTSAQITGASNTAIGSYTLMRATSANNSVAIGYNALASTSTGASNTAIGSYAGGGAAVNGSGSIFIGWQTGYYESGSNTLLIDNQDRTNQATGRVRAILYGIMASTPAAQTLTVNAALNVNPQFTASGINTVATLDAQGSGANNDGGSLSLLGKTSTTASVAMGLDQWLWVNATHASRTARRVFNVYDTAVREGLRIEASGSAPMIGFLGANAVVRPTALTAALTTITCTAPGTPDYAIADLTQTTPYGFVSADEGQSVLKVIANLQTRVGELETKLQALGLLT